MFSFFFMTKHALQHMKRGASIINTTSVTAYQGHKTLLDYSATKGAIVTFTRSLSQALTTRASASTRWRRGRSGRRSSRPRSTPSTWPSTAHSVPMKRPGQPNEVAPCYVFLASDEASYISGQVLHPNGGKVVGS